MEAADQPYTTFNNGVKFPKIGLGSYSLSEGDCKSVVLDAILNKNYRHIDTASFYKNEDVIGDALQEVFASGKIKREEIFITTKLWHEDKDDVEKGLR